ncbi:PH domain-containing protein [Cellulomonas sp. KRMCY2]|uniref:PH domain-containing protein n=1 Tax=Cellulomonas sp. KRMCY2 TaxID=1304865 RepID=UPI00045E9040|nr:PH domain-containing protein [Cellulomonas sp. KRMCY2]
MGPSQTIRPTFSRVLAALVALCCLLTLGIVAIDAGPVAALRVAGPCGGLALLTWTVLWRPLVEVSDGGVLLVNPWRTVHVPWPALDDVSARWALTVRTTDGRTFSAFAAPAPGAAGGDRVGLSGEAVGAVEARRDRLTAAGYLDEVRPEGAPVQVRTHVRTLVALAALVVLSALALAVPAP